MPVPERVIEAIDQVFDFRRKNSKRNKAAVLDDEPDNRMTNSQAGDVQGRDHRAAGNGKRVAAWFWRGPGHGRKPVAASHPGRHDGAQFHSDHGDLYPGDRWGEAKNGSPDMEIIKVQKKNREKGRDTHTSPLPVDFIPPAVYNILYT